MNNPSNPTGAVYSKEHLIDFLKLCDKYGLTVIADEIYGWFFCFFSVNFRISLGDMVYDNAVFHPLATLSPKVPILTCDGIAKRFLVPGWRLGWLIVYDPVRALGHVRDGLRNLAQKIVGPCAVSANGTWVSGFSFRNSLSSSH
jgi:tyrosine aminotransferase